MKIVTAANWRMRQYAKSCLKSAKRFHYDIAIYDLGKLGFGCPFDVENESFQENGYYRKVRPGRFSVADHKPQLIRNCLEEYGEFIVYLDADTIINHRIDEALGDYDVGLTVRPEWENKFREKNTRRSVGALGMDAEDFLLYDNYINGGVMFFNHTENAYRFIDEWESEMVKIPEDQGALNSMLKAHFPLKSGQTVVHNGIRIRLFGTIEYNYYYFMDLYRQFEKDLKVKQCAAKILHFKGRWSRIEYLKIYHPLKYKFLKFFRYL